MKTQEKINMLLIIVITALVAKPVTAQAHNKIFERRILIHVREIRIDSLLKILSRQTGVEFSYSSNKINPSGKLVAPKQSTTVSQWLDIVRRTSGVDYKLIGNHIIFIDRYKPNNTTRGNIKFKAPHLQTEIRKRNKLNSGVTSKDIKLADLSGKQAEAQRANLPDITFSITMDSLYPVETMVEHNPIATKEINAATTNAKQADKVATPSNNKAGEILSGSATALKDVEQEAYKKNAIQIIGGYSLHGSGDMKGIVFSTEYIRYLSKRFSLNYNLRATINNGKDEYIVNNTTTGTRTDASIRYTTAGVQLGVNAGYSIIKSFRHDLKFSLGTFGRYQSASNGSDGYSLYNPQTTGVPTFLIGYDNRTPQVTVAVGGLLELQYDFTFGNKVYVGLTPGFQTDTNGDAIPQVALAIGRRF